MFKRTKFNDTLLNWYQANKRQLPWRETSDPFKIWLSEVMLQQTQVITVIPYFEKFITKYKDLDALANADEEALLKDWEGLGYYNRIRNFHHAVKEVQEKYDSKVPSKPEEFFSLKGVGPYIGGAVQSIAFNNQLAAVDGNVLRVMTRLNRDNRDTTKVSVQKDIKNFIESDMPLEAGDFNQALMELGATICTPRTPKCVVCPVREHCEAFKKGEVMNYPVKKKAKKKAEYYYNVFFILNDKNEVLLFKQEGDLLKGMYELPRFDVDTSLESIEEKYGLSLSQPSDAIGEHKHVFTHKIWFMEGYVVRTTDQHENFISLDKVRDLPMSVAMQKMFKMIDGL
ncbi:A/G-specific adenine glycosylase [Jeotgalicoccus meleagridis]|uniref:Adenine DNA glycosylase n=1 Tax=Jeotgalicoccus meleagridis TaxID=2759181 RepID=A0A6V7RDR4_9STAP|nr:A/G-specific adenine glycosylase [Jeotgalicoccus meleagridis]CAD2075068.1 putative A/G-specific adenine glycosylase YfhQ [Jeotgalicoccus meleagridis]